MWDTCKLRSYYNYIGKWEGYRGTIRREKLHWLSKKTNWFFVVGQLVHEAIESQVAQRSLGRPVSEEAAQNLVRYKLEKIRENPNDFLVEVVNGTDVTDEDFHAAEMQILSLLDVFFDIIWPPYEKFGYEQHEKFESFMLEDIKVNLKVDLVSKMDDGTIIVTDWKTQELHGLREEQKRQLLVYLLWAMDKYGVGHDRVKAEVRPLPLPEKQLIHDASEEEIKALKQFVLENGRAMLSVETEEDFPSSPDIDLCRSCNYATICPAGQQFLPKDRRLEPILPGRIAAD